MSSIGIIINPNARKIKKMDSPVDYYRSIGKDLLDIRLTKDKDDVIKAAKAFRKNKIKYMAISGGDGSIHLVLSVLSSVYKNTPLPNILILRDGTMNNVARSYNQKGKGSEILARFIRTIEKGEDPEIVYRDTIKVGDMCCFMFGLGYVSTFIEEFNKDKSIVRVHKIILKSIRDVFSRNKNGFFFKAEYTMRADDKTIPIDRYLLVYAATIKNLALSFNPAYRAYEKDNTFHLIASGVEPQFMLLNLRKVRTGKLIKHILHYDNIVSKLEIIHKGEFSYQMDGDIYYAKDRLVAKAGPRVGFVKV